MNTPQCPCCLSPSVNVERIKADRFFCSVCSHVFALDAGGIVILQEPMNHAPKRKTDVNGYPIDD